MYISQRELILGINRILVKYKIFFAITIVYEKYPDVLLLGRKTTRTKWTISILPTVPEMKSRRRIIGAIDLGGCIAIRENLSENEGVDDGIFFVAVRRDPLSVKPRGWPAANAELCL